MISAERKKFGLRAGRKTTKATRLSHCVLVHTREETGFCYISFSDDFEAHVAKEMPRGLAAFDPAFIQVDQARGVWVVQAVYIKDGKHSILWRAADKPTWIGKLRKEKPDGCHTNHKD